MKKWELTFRFNEEDRVYEADVPEEAQELLKGHPYLGISFKRRGTLQMFSQEEAEGIGEKLMHSDSSRGIPAARLFFRYLEMMTGPEVVQIPFGMADFLHMDEWESLSALLEETEDGHVYLYENAGELQLEKTVTL